jgi:hypothetical protein
VTLWGNLPTQGFFNLYIISIHKFSPCV